MKKYKKVILSGVFLLIVAMSFVLGRFSNTENDYLEDKPKQVKEKNLLSYYLENENGEYEAASGETWPTDGYKFNATLSKCENGGELGWDSTKGVVTMTGNMSDKCYIYFDIYSPTLAEYVISQYNGIQGENNIYYHNGTITSDDGTILDAQDNSYRYAGASDVVNNYVCFGSDEDICPTDNFYRIIGVFDGQIKLIKATAATSTLLGTDGAYAGSDTKYKWTSLESCPSSTTGYITDNSNGIMFMSNRKDTLSAGVSLPTGCNVWKYSDLNTTNLNTNYITNIGTKWSEMIEETIWKVGGNTDTNISYVVPSVAYQNEIVNSEADAVFKAQIGLMYVSDYEFAASPSAWTLVGYNSSDETKDYRAATNINWLYLGSFEWTVSRNSSYSTKSFCVTMDGFIKNYAFGYTGGVVYYAGGIDTTIQAIRPTFYLNSDVTYVSGSGSSTDPIRIS